ncbi:hypothetical protein [Pusillimonas sp. NJUB218]|uniref:hypothetical protein n=1 Tax=Pusillimonas sp. NJUB218 TaxID=2023230 RepID=UPI000F4BCD3A|nr:hypothetical protein [Pusillimonas sp. NJUB218]ROT44023.1 hypothetical protein CHR62_14475 [Pusillimonas sp. NJUB218]
MSLEVLAAAGAIFLSTLMLRVGGRMVIGQSPWRSKFALGGDFGDAMTHLLLAEIIRRNSHRLPKNTPEFILSGPQDYPAFFHWFLSLFSKRTLERFEWLFSPTVEAIHATMIFLAFYFWVPEFTGITTVFLPITMAVAWILSPGLSIDVRRGAFLNERVFGFLFSNLYFLSLSAWLIAGHPAAFGCALIAGCIVAVSSKFGMQAIVFITPLVALGLLDFKPLMVLVLLVACATILSGGYALFVWKGSLRHTAFYARYLVHVGDYVNSFSTRQFREAAHLLRRGGVRSALRLVLNHPLVKIFTNSPAIWFALAALIFNHPVSQVVFVLLALILAAVVVALITTTDSFKFLGEGERYLEVVIAPALFLLTAVASDLNVWLGGLIAYSVMRLAVAWYPLLRNRAIGSGVASSSDTKELLDWLAQEPSHVIYSVPGRLAYPIAYAATQHRYIWWFTNTPERERQADFERLFEGGSRYPYPSPQQVYSSWRSVRADIVVLHRSTIAACKAAWGCDYGTIDGKDLFSNDTYLVIGLRSHGGGRGPQYD